MNAAEHIDSAKAAIARGKAQDATAHALIAIAEALAAQAPKPAPGPVVMPTQDWER